MAVPMGAGCVKFDFGKAEDLPTASSSHKRHSSNIPSRQRSLMTATVGHGACAATDCTTVKQNECDVSAVKEIAKDKTIVYIFGGPGSKKGCIVENLMATYGFHLISIEEVILNDMQTQTSESNSSADQTQPDGILKVKQILHDYPDQLTLSWILDHLAAEIRRRQSQSHILIDLLPNFQFMLEAASFAPPDCAVQMETLETKLPSLVALYLDARHHLPHSPLNQRNSISQCLDGAPIAEIKSEFDIAKMQLRHSTFIQVVKPYLEYFGRRMRLITIDTSRASSDHVWFHVNELFETLNFRPKGSVNPTVVFATGNHDINIQPEKSYTILRLLPHEFYSNEQHLLEDLGHETQKVLMSSKPLVVICHVANTLQLDAEHPSQEKCIKYLEKEDEFTRLELTLGNHCDMSNEGNDFKAISTPGNVVCFFPRRMDDAICRQVAAHVSTVIQKNLKCNYT
uniref:Adenylate kinase n=1 Tax=Strigamia maritima TaxID=126957 RepID=T1J988_STRMM